ncbi:hypothetical protein C8Q77DRAFT_1094743 [Trametes polyzona]|nr:hypothetical protein C8Q77DRAFT_1094743 [Trametes polyzona]
MNSEVLDTETMLAMLSSLLQPDEYEHAVLLDALLQANGDIAAAARCVLEPPKKRRKPNDGASIEGWVTKSRPAVGGQLPATPVVATTHLKHTNHTTPSASDAGVSSRQVIPAAKSNSSEEWKAIFTRAGGSTSSGKLSVSRSLPLTLSTPGLVAEHTPCTLHHSVLPPELACRYTFQKHVCGVQDYNSLHKACITAYFLRARIGSMPAGMSPPSTDGRQALLTPG